MISDTELRGLRVLHAALVVGCALALVTAAVASPTPYVDRPWFTGELELIGVFTLVLIPSALIFFNRSLAAVRAGIGPAQGMSLRSALIVHWALIEAPALFNAASCFVGTGKGNLLAGGIAIAALIPRMPNRARVDRWCLGN